MFFRRPIAIDQLGTGTSKSLARLAALEGLARAVLVALAPLLALEALGTKAAVSHAYLAASIFTLCITLNLDKIERLLARRWVVTLAGIALAGAAGLLYAGSGAVFALGLSLRSAAASMFSVCMSLYIMDYIGKHELSHNESRRMIYVGGAWLIGPAIGLWLSSHVAHSTPFVVSAGFAFALIGYFWYLRLGRDPVVRAARSSASNPLRAVHRYMGQARLRIAYSITVSRSCFWVALFIYGPIYVVEAGMPKWSAGALLSASSALLFLSPVVRYGAERFGTRALIVSGLSITGVSLIVLGLIGQARPVGIVFWLLAAIGGAILDVLGNIPFMRSVRPRERTEMTMVFSTWREVSELLTPTLASLVLLMAPFWTLFFVLAAMHFATAVGASRLPRRL